MSKNINARIALKRDTSANWESSNPVILNGELILVDTAAGELRAKVGDGTKTYTQLPFTDEVLRSLITDVDNNNSAVVVTKDGESRLLDTFNVIKLTQEEYDELEASDLLDPDALYLTEGGEEQAYSKVVMTEGDETKVLEEFHIVKLTQEEYDAMMEAGTNDPDTLYMTEAGEAEGATQVIMTDSGVATELEEFHIVKISQVDYESMLAAGTLDPYTFYWTEENLITGDDEEDTNSNLVYQRNAATLTNLTITDTTPSTSINTGSLIVSGGVGISGDIYANNVYGAVWNDYAEYRRADSIEPGRVVVENGDDTMSLSMRRLQYGGKVVSDTYGFAIGETKNAKTPIAVSGRVLVYTQEDRELFREHIGRPVCTGENGTVSIMSETEEKLYPSAIVGYVSAVPNYSIWEETDVKVDGRIWIYVR